MTKRDAGLEAIDRLFEDMQIDEKWAVRTGRGFTWWGYRLAQHVTADPPGTLPELGHTASTVRISTDLIRDVSAKMNPAVHVGLANGEQTLNAVVWDEQSATISECCTAVVHEENIDGLRPLIATAAIFQNAAAHSRARAMAELVGGVVAASDHPTSGERPDWDDILNIPAAMFGREGQKPSAFAGEVMERLGPFVEKMGLLGFASDEEFTCEVPFTGSRPAAVVMQTNEPIESSLVRIFANQPHPQVGTGALVILALPTAFDTSEEAALTANRLNLAEARTTTHTTLLGAWCAHTRQDAPPELAYNCFVPNALARPGLLENLVIYEMVRSKFAAGQLSA